MEFLASHPWLSICLEESGLTSKTQCLSQVASMSRVSMESGCPALRQPGRGRFHQRPTEYCGGETYLLQQVGGAPSTARLVGWSDAVNDTGQRSSACMTSTLQSSCQSLAHCLIKVFACYCPHSAVGPSAHLPSKEERVEASPRGPQCGPSYASLPSNLSSHRATHYPRTWSGGN